MGSDDDAEGGRPAPEGGEVELDEPVRPAVTVVPELPREETLERSFDRIIEEGRPRLRRTWLDTVATGAVGGMEVAFGVLALLLVESRTGSQLLGGLAFSVGFIGLLLGHSELFTEGFLVPVTVVAGEARVRDLLRLWAGTLAGNLAGGCLMAYLIDVAFPSLSTTAVHVAAYYIREGITARTFVLSVLAGAAITLLTRMHQGTDSEVAKLVASVAIAWVLAGFRLFHSILDSILAFTALNTGRATFGWEDWLTWVGWVLFGNLTGGLLLTTLLRMVRARARLIDHRVAKGLPVPGVSTSGVASPGHTPAGHTPAGHGPTTPRPADH
ncbi:formate/nitrite transporter family protein [Acidimicrobiaceae bacterium USS-CC1]|uniref:Formate/nitrite transporter family protein n=1 Tax=Acidiferrimicrobium australe TaxID=2664430 RepID=A0ABW9QZ89_9ACTN|nr:formate/nitrite transporter family protein [Acidiferrimicrobium australe]